MSGNNMMVRKILFMVGCIVFAMVFAVTTKTIIEYKGNTFDKEKSLGAAVTQTCDAGYWYSVPLQDCVKCPAGKYCDGSGSSTACAAGYYQDELGQSSCKVCPSGTYQDSTGQTSCKECNGAVNSSKTSCETTFTINCNATSIRVGESTTCSASGTSAATTFVSSNTAVATVIATRGEVKGISAGITTITAISGSLSASKQITVMPNTLSISCGAASIPVGKVTGCKVLYNESDVTSNADITSSNTAVATVSSAGIVTGKSANTVTITAEYGGLKATKQITVTENTLSISCNATSIKVGATTTCRVLYDDIDYTHSGKVSYSSSNETAATVNSEGVVSGKSANTVTITAEYGGLKATKQITVTEDTLSISCSPTAINVGGTSQCKVLYNGSTDVTSSATYEGSTGVTVSAAGLVTGNAVSSPAIIKATYKGVTASTSVTVANILLTCNPTSISVGKTSQCKVIHNGTDVTSNANFTSSDNTIATVSYAGLVTGKSANTVTITASYSGTTVTSKITISEKTSDTVNNYKIAASKSKIYLAKSNDSILLDVNIYDSDGKTVKNSGITVKSAKGYVNLSTSPSNYSGSYYPLSITSNGNGGGSGSSTVSDTVTVCIENTSICNTVTVYIHCAPWTEVNSTKTFATGWLLSNAHVTSGRCNYMDPSLCKRIENSDGTVTYECSKYYNRCCGATGGGSTSTTETPACYSNNSTGIYAWGTYKNNSNYALVSTIKNETDCKTPTPSKDEPSGSGDEEVYACYKDNENNYEWSSSPTPGYTLVESIKDKDNCKIIDDAACYYDENGKYRWGSYSNNPLYTLVDTVKVADKCNTPPACYRDTNGDFVWGDYAYNSAYSLVTNITNQNDCGEIINVPSTGANKAAIVYISVIVMLISGGLFVYIVYNKKRFN